MTQTPIPKLITSMAVPTIVSMLITGLYNLADTYFVACMKSDSATAAVGVVFSLMALIQAMGFTLGMGSGSLISRLLGQKDREKAQQVAVSGFAAALAFGVILAAVGLIWIDPLMSLLGATDTVAPYARSYASYILYGAPVMAGAFVLNNVLRAEGHATLSMVGITTGGILNILLDPLFIFHFELGIAGAALATLVSQCVSLLILLSCFLSKKSLLHLVPGSISKSPALYLEIIRTGLPSFCRQGLASVATVALNRAAMVYGDPAVAAMSVVSKVFMLIASALIGFGQGYQPVVGFNYGANRLDRVCESFFFTLRTGLAMMTALASLGFVFAPVIIGFFGSGEMHSIGVVAMRAQCVGLVFQVLGVVTNMTFQTIGRSAQATFLSACRQGVYFLPLILTLPRWWGLPGVEYTQALSDVLTCLTCIPFLISFFHALRDREAELASLPHEESHTSATEN